MTSEHQLLSWGRAMTSQHHLRSVPWSRAPAPDPADPDHLHPDPAATAAPQDPR